MKVGREANRLRVEFRQRGATGGHYIDAGTKLCRAWSLRAGKVGAREGKMEM